MDKYNHNNRKFQFWIQDTHPVELGSPKWKRQKLNYIHLNTVRAELVEQPVHYLNFSASNYETRKGLFDVAIIDLGLTIGYLRM